MSVKSDNSELLITDTLVPDIFITQHIQGLSKNAICLYMWLLMIVGNTPFNESEIKNYSVLSNKDLKEAFAELISQDLVLKKKDLFVLADLKKREVDEYCKAVIARGGSLDDISMSSDSNRDVLAKSINKTFYLGKMAQINWRLIDKCLYEYEFDPTVVYALFEEARNCKQLYAISYIEKVAESWFKKGYTTPDKLKAMFDARGKKDEIIKLLGKLMRKALDGVDIERVEKWVFDYNVTSEMVEYAYRCNDFRKTITVRNVDDKLKEWYLSEVDTLDKAIVYENKKHEENKARVSKSRARYDNPLKTGREMGIKVESTVSKVVENNDSDDEDDEILNLFGGNNANN